MASTHEHGQMEIREQSQTYDGFVQLSISAGLLLAATLFFVTLHFAAHVNAIGSFALGSIVALVGGFAMKRRIGYYFLTFATLIVMLVAVLILAAFTG